MKNGINVLTNYTYTKEAGDIPQVTHEGTYAIKVSKLKKLTTKFENIRMHENHKLSDIVVRIEPLKA